MYSCTYDYLLKVHFLFLYLKTCDTFQNLPILHLEKAARADAVEVLATEDWRLDRATLVRVAQIATTADVVHL